MKETIDTGKTKKRFDDLIEKLEYRYFIEDTEDNYIKSLNVGRFGWGNDQVKQFGFIFTFLPATHDVFEWAYSTLLFAEPLYDIIP